MYVFSAEISKGSTENFDLGASGFSDGVMGYGGVSFTNGDGKVEITLMDIHTIQAV